MGVQGLHPLLKEIKTDKTLNDYRGKTLAVDTYSWLHKATISCAQELCLEKPTQKYVTSVIKKVNMLRHFGVEPYLVFDGASLPTKAATAHERRVKREEARAKADSLVKLGNSKLAWKEFMKAAGVTSEMAKSVMIELDRLKVKYLVAPYEADPQMVYLEKLGLVDGILSEDSDLLIFGCNRLITKLNDFGECVEICKQDFDKVTLLDGLAAFTPEQLRLVAMLSGCDYTKGVPGIGLKTAFEYIKTYQTVDRVLLAMRAKGKKPPVDFDTELIKADLAFQYQKVFNPESQTLETLNEYPADFSHDMSIVEECCGLTLEHHIHVGISNGKLNPHTHEVLLSREQNLGNLRSKSTTTRTGSGATNGTLKTTASKRGRIDSFFTARKITSLPLPPKPPMKSPQVSPVAKRTKVEVSGETPKVSGKFSKFFKTPPKADVLTPVSVAQEADITGDSDITEASSPFNHVKSSQATKKDILDALTDDDEDIEDSIPKEETQVKAFAEFELDDDDFDIEESPVKLQKSPDRKAGKIKLLREKFLFNPNQKFDASEIPKRKERQLDSFSSSTSSIDLKTDDLRSDEFDADKENRTLETFKIKTSSLSHFAFTG